MKLEAGSSLLLRLEAVTALHTGSAAGEASLDRPVQKDAQTGLPFLPDSALKGVLAGRYGDVPDETPNRKREDRFGSPDRSGHNGAPPSTGRPGPLVLGNGELLAFPVPSRPGPTWAFPALTLAWALRFEPGATESGALLSLLSEIERSAGKAFAWPKLPLLDVPLPPEPLSGVSVRQQEQALVALLRRLAGPSLPADAPLAVLSSRDAARLWPAASDRRVLTALDSSTRTVVGGALRRVELIPPGALFLSLVTCETGFPAAFCELDDDLFQIGAWESLGLGWMRPSRVPPTAAPPVLPQTTQAGPPSRFLQRHAGDGGSPSDRLSPDRRSRSPASARGPLRGSAFRRTSPVLRPRSRLRLRAGQGETHPSQAVERRPSAPLAARGLAEARARASG